MVANNNTAVDPDEGSWYADSGANSRLTVDLNNLQLKNPFNGFDTVVVGNGSGLPIQNTGSSIIQTANNKFLLKRVLHCLDVAANLLSINRFSLDNDCYFILTGSQFLINDFWTGRLLLEGPSINGLYPSCPMFLYSTALCGIFWSFCFL
jgi:hypothetical protein